MTGWQDLGIPLQNASILFLLTPQYYSPFFEGSWLCEFMGANMNDRWEEQSYPFPLLNCEAADNASASAPRQSPVICRNINNIKNSKDNWKVKWFQWGKIRKKISNVYCKGDFFSMFSNLFVYNKRTWRSKLFTHTHTPPVLFKSAFICVLFKKLVCFTFYCGHSNANQHYDGRVAIS